MVDVVTEVVRKKGMKDSVDINVNHRMKRVELFTYAEVSFILIMFRSSYNRLTFSWNEGILLLVCIFILITFHFVF